jgi:hypothetical protein
MRRRNACLVGITLTLFCAAAGRGQDAVPSKAAATLPSKQKWVRFAVIRGRVAVFLTRGHGAAAWT